MRFWARKREIKFSLCFFRKFSWQGGLVVVKFILLSSDSVNKGEFPSGQRGQTVNLLATPSVVRIHLPPPEKSTCESKCFFQLNPPLRVGEILLCNVKYACGVWNSPRRRVGGFNFTWCDSIKFHNLRSKLFHRERKRTISLKTNGYVRVRIHMQKQQKYLFRSP